MILITFRFLYAAASLHAAAVGLIRYSRSHEHSKCGKASYNSSGGDGFSSRNFYSKAIYILLHSIEREKNGERAKSSLENKQCSANKRTK